MKTRGVKVALNWLKDSSPSKKSIKSESEYQEEEEKKVSKVENTSRRKKYEIKFRPVWLKDFGAWLKEDKTSKYGKICMHCNHPLAGGFTHLLRHSKTPHHILKMKNVVIEPVMQKFKVVEKRDPSSNPTYILEEELTTEDVHIDDDSTKIQSMFTAEIVNYSNENHNACKKFRPKWMNEFGEWLRKDKTTKSGKICIYCRKAVFGNRSHLLRHSLTPYHVHMAKVAAKKEKTESMGLVNKIPVRQSYITKFRKVWLEEFGDWLKEDSSTRGGKICIYCHKSINGGRSHILRHSKSSHHINMMKPSDKPSVTKPSVINPLKIQELDEVYYDINPSLQEDIMPTTNAEETILKITDTAKDEADGFDDQEISTLNEELLEMDVINDSNLEPDENDIECEESTTENETEIIDETKSLGKKNKRKKYDIQFVPQWLNEFGAWLKRDTKTQNGKYCKYCLKSVAGGHAHLKRHSRVPQHIANMKIFDVNSMSIMKKKLTRSLKSHNLPTTALDSLKFGREHNQRIFGIVKQLKEKSKNYSREMESQQLCITCLKLNTQFYSIYKISAEHNTNYADMLSICTNIPISTGNGLPKVICTGCSNELKNAFTFRLQSDVALEGLNNLLNGDEKQKFVEASDPLVTHEDDEVDINNDAALDSDTEYFEPILINSKVDTNKDDELEMETLNPRYKTNFDTLDSECSSDEDSNYFEDFEVSKSTTNSMPRKPKDKESLQLHQCLICPEKFLGIKALSEHVTDEHGPFESLDCTYCGQWHSCQDRYLKHVIKCASKYKCEENGTICSICNLTFQTVRGLKLHMGIHQTAYKCKFCDQEFSKQKDMIEHYKTHTDELILCDICGENIMTRAGYSLHMARHLGIKAHLCSYCQRKFTTKCELKLHERYHTGEKPRKCNWCLKEFTRQSTLSLHIRTHTGEKPYKCKYCDKSFAQSQDLKTHTRRHTGQRFTCSLCGDEFIQKYHLTRHLKTKHDITDPDITYINERMN